MVQSIQVTALNSPSAVLRLVSSNEMVSSNECCSNLGSASTWPY